MSCVCVEAQAILRAQASDQRQEGRDLVGRLLKSLYGTRDAAANWERQICSDLGSLGFVQGKATPCVFFHPQRNLRVSVHGDDFTTLGKIDDLKWFSQQLRSIWIIEERGLLGPRQASGHSSGDEAPFTNVMIINNGQLINHSLIINHNHQLIHF